MDRSTSAGSRRKMCAISFTPDDKGRKPGGNVNKTWLLILVGLSVALPLLSVVLAVILWRQPRFITTKGENPYIMFDTRTIQACWAGSPSTPSTDTDLQPFSTPPATDSGKELFSLGPPHGCADDLFKKYGGHETGCLTNPAGLPFCRDLE